MIEDKDQKTKESENSEIIPRQNEVRTIAGAVITGFMAGVTCVLSLLKMLNDE